MGLQTNLAFHRGYHSCRTNPPVNAEIPALKDKPKACNKCCKPILSGIFLKSWNAWNILDDAIAKLNFMDSVDETITKETTIPGFYACSFTRLVTVQAFIKDD